MRKMLFVVLLSFFLVGNFASCSSHEEGVKHPNDFSTSASADAILEEVKAGGYVVFEDGHCTAGKDIWQDFYQTVSNGKSASVNFAKYYTLDREHVSEELYEAEKEKYPMIFLGNLGYDGKKYTVTVRLSTEKKPETNRQYKYLMQYTGEPSSPYAAFSHYEYYVLVNDDSVTWEEIEKGMLSSILGAQIDHYMVYMDHTDKAQ